MRELIAYRELLVSVLVRDVKLRYRQTVLGVTWAVVQPLVAMVVFTIAFNRGAGLKSEAGVPYTVYSYSGLIIWLYFADALGRAGRSLITNSALVTKVYFPRIIPVVSSVLAPLLDFAFAFAILLVLMGVYGIAPNWTILLAFPLIGVSVICALAFGVWMAALNVEYRDIGYALPLIIQMWMFLSPIAYSVSSLHGALRLIYEINPMAGIVLGFRWALLHQGNPFWEILGISLVPLFAVLISGLIFFAKVERNFADSI